MLALVLTLAGGVCAGWAGGGQLRRLGRLPVVGLSLLVAAAAAQLLAAALAGSGPAWVRGASALSAGLAVAFLARNRRLPGTGLVAAGLVANALVVLLNGTMPVSSAAARRAGVPAAAVSASTGHRLGTRAATLSLLADEVPLPLPGGEQVLSAGDVLVLAGLGLLVAATMLGGADGASPVRGARRVWEHSGHGQEEAQASVPRQERSEPRQASQHLIPRG